MESEGVASRLTKQMYAGIGASRTAFLKTFTQLLTVTISALHIRTDDYSKSYTREGRHWTSEGERKRGGYCRFRAHFPKKSRTSSSQGRTVQSRRSGTENAVAAPEIEITRLQALCLGG